MTRYHFGVMITGALLCFAPATMASNAWAIFLVPVSAELGVSAGAFSLQPSILYLSSALFAPIGGILIKRFDLKVVLAGCSLAVGLAFIASGLSNHLWQFYVLGSIEGCAGVVLIALMLPNLISRWFEKKMGTVIGGCIAMAGFGGALWAYLGGLIIVSFGWRMAYFSLGSLCLAIALPACFFLLHNYPSDVAVQPFGSSNDALDDLMEKRVFLKGVSAKIAFGSMVFILFSVGIGLLNGVIAMTNLLPSYVYYLGGSGFFSLSSSEVVIAASIVALCVQLSQACCKIILGILADRNVALAFVLAVASGISAAFCLIFGRSFLVVVFAGGALFGALFAVLDVLSPVLMRKFFGYKEYPRIYARFAMIVNLVPAFSVLVYAYLSEYDWNLVLLVAGMSLVATMICGLLAMRFSKKYKEYSSV